MVLMDLSDQIHQKQYTWHDEVEIEKQRQRNIWKNVHRKLLKIIQCQLSHNQTARDFCQGCG